ncbi:MAG: hypothetical protein EOP08_04565 [Proteobacteria bacterium]|nr:MAG: hypothetical protein EOP08_04565 [Pseudomonadota bacterium]
MRKLVIALFGLVACKQPAAPLGPGSAPSASASADNPKAPASAAAPASSAAPDPGSGVAVAPAFLPPPDFGPPGPIVVTGYSRIVGTGMNDPAYASGFTHDGAWLGYCAEIGARTPGRTTCELVSERGETKSLSSDVGEDFDAAAQRALDAFVKEQKLPLVAGGMDRASAPALHGTWRFARDLTLALDEHAQGKRGAAVRLGGRVGHEKPVYPIFVDLAPPAASLPFHTSWVNSLSLSPDGRELGLVAGFFCMEWCDSFAVRRLPVARLAAQIYNDTGMRHHGAKDYDGSAALFEKAVHADPSFALAAYNLACAYARLQRPSTRAALEHAIRLEASAKTRAATDADFEAVKAEPWFAAAVK